MRHAAAAGSSSHAALAVTPLQGMLQTADVQHSHASLSSSSAQHAALAALPSTASVAGMWAGASETTPSSAGGAWAHAAAELIDNLLHEDWFARHGAALCLCPLLRWALGGWAFGSEQPVSWARPLAARLVLLLTHERFGDYSDGVLVAPVVQAACACLSQLAPHCQPGGSDALLAPLLAAADSPQWLHRFAAAEGLLALQPLLGGAACLRAALRLLGVSVAEVRRAARRCLVRGRGGGGVKGAPAVDNDALAECVPAIIQGALGCGDLSPFPEVACAALREWAILRGAAQQGGPSERQALALACVLLQHHNVQVQHAAQALLLQLLAECRATGTNHDGLHGAAQASCRALLLHPTSEPAVDLVRILQLALRRLSCPPACAACRRLAGGLGQLACTPHGESLNHWLVRDTVLHTDGSTTGAKSDTTASSVEANADFAAGGGDWAAGDWAAGLSDDDLDEYIVPGDGKAAAASHSTVGTSTPLSHSGFVSELGALEARLLRGHPPCAAAGVGSSAMALALRSIVLAGRDEPLQQTGGTCSAASACAMALQRWLHAQQVVAAAGDAHAAGAGSRLCDVQSDIASVLSEMLPDRCSDTVRSDALDAWAPPRALCNALASATAAAACRGAVTADAKLPSTVEWDCVVEVQPLLQHARSTAAAYIACLSRCLRAQPAVLAVASGRISGILAAGKLCTPEELRDTTKQSSLQQLQQLSRSPPSVLCAPQLGTAAAACSDSDEDEDEDEGGEDPGALLALTQERDRILQHLQASVADVVQRVRVLRSRTDGLLAALQVAGGGAQQDTLVALRQLSDCASQVDCGVWHWCVCMALRGSDVPASLLPASASASGVIRGVQGGLDRGSPEDEVVILSAATRACVTLSACCHHPSAVLGEAAWVGRSPGAAAWAQQLASSVASAVGEHAGQSHTTTQLPIVRIIAAGLRGVLLAAAPAAALSSTVALLAAAAPARHAVYEALDIDREGTDMLRLAALLQAREDAGSTVVPPAASAAARRLLLRASRDTLSPATVDQAPTAHQRHLQDCCNAMRSMCMGSSEQWLQELPPGQWQPACRLRRYQRTGVGWMLHLWRSGFGGCLLADDMGLGKTVQVLAALAASAVGEGHAPALPPKRVLVVAPAAVGLHWARETQAQFGHCSIGGRSVFQVQQLKAFLPQARQQTGDAAKAAAASAGGDTSDTSDSADSKGSLLRVCIISYHKLRQHRAALADIPLFGLVLDEAHLCVNPSSATFGAAAQLRAQRRALLTGTPIQNRVLDMWSLFHLAVPGMLGGRAEFHRRYGRAAARARRQLSPEDTVVAARECAAALRELHARTAPFVLRRSKAQVLTQLPPKVLQDVPCALTPSQRRLYSEWQQQQRSQNEDGVNLVNLPAGCTQTLPGSALRRLASLLAICNHPELAVPPTQGGRRKRTRHTPAAEHSGKLLALIHLLNGIWFPGSDTGDSETGGGAALPAAAPSPALTGGGAALPAAAPSPALPKRRRGDRAQMTEQIAQTEFKPPTAPRAVAAPGGGGAAQLALARAQAGQLRCALSAEVAAAGELLAGAGAGATLPADDSIGDALLRNESFVEAEAGAAGGVLLFAQQQRALQLVEESVLQVHFPQVPRFFVHGGVSAQARQAAVDAFQSGSGPRLLLLTTSVGGLGLNLQTARDVIFLDHSWNPQADLQAQDRAHRLGQRHMVTVHRLLAADTVEERLMGVQRFKLHLAQALLSTTQPEDKRHTKDASAFLGSF